MHIQTVLQQLGYSPNQVIIYLAALKMGETKIADIAEQVAMPRTTVTELVEELHKHGLMNYYAKRGRKYWVAENPDKLMIALKENEAALLAILPQLQAMKFESGESKPNIRYYKGVAEVKNIFNDIITTKHNMLATVSWDDFREYFGNNFSDDFIERRNSHNLRIRLITPKTALAEKLKFADAKELRITRFLPNNIELHRISNFIYGDKVAIISMNRKEPMGIVICDPDVAYAMTIYFESLWLHSMA